MYKLIHRDILTVDYGIIVQSVNHRGVMGAGLAKDVLIKYPDVYIDYKRICDTISFDWIKRYGFVSFYSASDILLIASIFGQDNFGRGQIHTDYVSLGNGLDTVRLMAEKRGLPVYIPFGLGCGLGGGVWNTVVDIITDCFKYSSQVDLYVCKKS